MINIKQFTFNAFEENTYVLFDETLEAVIIDPGCMSAGEQIQLSSFIAENNLKPVKLLNTHCHIDHIFGNEYVIQQYKVDLYLHEKEIITYQDTKRWSIMFNLPDFEIPQNHVFINENDSIEFGNSSLNCLFVPGHSIASMAFYNKINNFVVSGDVIFKGGVGRTDLPNGSLTTLLQSIKNKIYTLPDETVIYSGHGNTTLVGNEKKNNPFTKNLSN